MSAYNYTFNAPTNLLDPDGRCPTCDSGYNMQMTNLGGVSASDIPDVPDGIQRRAGGGLKTFAGTGMTLAGVGMMVFPEPTSSGVGAALTVGGLGMAGLGPPVAGAGLLDMAVGDEPRIPSYTGGGGMVTRGTDYELAGQAFDFGVGLLAPTGKLPSLLGTMGKRLDQASNVSTLFDGLGLVQSLSEEKPLQGTVFESGIQAPDHRTRNEEVGIGGTVSPVFEDADR